jgi:hypothetical protein
MNPKQFLSGLLLTIGLQLVVNAGLFYFIPSLKVHEGFILITILVMALFCITLYTAARVVVKSTLTRLFIQLVMIVVFIKMALCLALVVVYKKAFDPVDNSFIWSFLFIYITATIYEVIFLDKIGRQKNKTTA